MGTIVGMRPPSKKEAKGFDVVVWVDTDGDIVCRAFTPGGDEYLKNLVNHYERSDIVQIYSDPEEFYKSVPPDLVVGLLTHNGVKTMGSPRLH